MYRISSNNAWVLIPKLTLDEYRLGDGGEFGSRLFNWCNGNNLPRICWAMSKVLKRECQKGGDQI